MVSADEPDDQPRMSLGEHLEELRRRILYALAGLGVAMTASLLFGRWLIRLLEYPFAQVMGAAGQDSRLAVLSTTAAVGVYFRVCLIAGAILASPWIFYQLWMFVSAGLYAREKRYAIYAVPLSVVLFVGGAAFFLFVVAVPALRFLIGFAGWLDVRPVVTLQEHIGFMTVMMLVFGVTFQTPMVVLVLAKMRLVTIRTLNRYHRHVIVVIVILAAVLTPPDPVEQILLAVPMILLYELGVLLAYVFVGKPHPTEVPTLGEDT